MEICKLVGVPLAGNTVL